MKFFSCLLGATLICSASLLHAQNGEQEIRRIIQNQVNAIDQMRTPLDVKDYMEILTPTYTSIRSDYLVDGTVNHTNVSKEELQNRLNSYALNTRNPLSYKLDKINFVNVLGNTGVANYTTNFEVTSNGTPTLEGFQNITSTLVKTNQGWKIARSHITEVRTLMQQYTCTFKLFTENPNSYMAKVHYPMGNHFETDFIEVKLEDMGGNNYMLNTNKGDRFAWENGTLKIPSTESGVMRSAVATSQPAVFRELVKYYHPSHCPEAALQK